MEPTATPQILNDVHQPVHEQLDVEEGISSSLRVLWEDDHPDSDSYSDPDDEYTFFQARRRTLIDFMSRVIDACDGLDEEVGTHTSTSPDYTTSLRYLLAEDGHMQDTEHVRQAAFGFLKSTLKRYTNLDDQMTDISAVDDEKVNLIDAVFRAGEILLTPEKTKTVIEDMERQMYAEGRSMIIVTFEIPTSGVVAGDCYTFCIRVRYSDRNSEMIHMHYYVTNDCIPGMTVNLKHPLITTGVGTSTIAKTLLNGLDTEVLRKRDSHGNKIKTIRQRGTQNESMEDIRSFIMDTIELKYDLSDELFCIMDQIVKRLHLQISRSNFATQLEESLRHHEKIWECMHVFMNNNKRIIDTNGAFNKRWRKMQKELSDMKDSANTMLNSFLRPAERLLAKIEKTVQYMNQSADGTVQESDDIAYSIEQEDQEYDVPDDTEQDDQEYDVPDDIEYEVPHSFLCPITREPFYDAVVCSDGFTYERCAVVNYMKLVSKETGEPAKSPMTREVLKSTVYPNLSLMSVMKHFMGYSLQLVNNLGDDTKCWNTTLIECESQRKRSRLC